MAKAKTKTKTKTTVNTKKSVAEVAAATIVADKDRYKKVKSASGKSSLSCGDAVAECLEGLSIDQLHEVTDKLLPDLDTRSKYGHLNLGMQRMSIGNRIRGFVNNRIKENEEAVTTGTKAKPDPIASLTKITGPMQTRNAKEATKANKAA